MELKSGWKDKLNDLVNTCQGELKKTTEIGKKMFSAGKENVQLTETYEKLGKLVFKDLDEGSLQWENEEASEYCAEIKNLVSKLEQLETDVKNIKES